MSDDGYKRCWYSDDSGTQAMLILPIGLVPPPKLVLHRPLAGEVPLIYQGPVPDSPEPGKETP